MKFCWCTINVGDMEKSIAFYRDIIRLPVTRRYQAGPDTEIAFLGEEDAQIELICHQGKQAVSMGEDISLGFEVPSLDETMAFVKSKGIAIASGPFQPNPHIRFFFVLDPNGLKIQLVQHG